MHTTNLPSLKIGNLCASKPIVQGGMGVGISLSGLASAVANEGGVGIISSVALGALNPRQDMNFRKANIFNLRQEIRKARQLSTGIIGVNIMVALTDYDDLVKASIEEEVDLLALGAGLPLKFAAELDIKSVTKTHFAPIVSSGRAANLIFKQWQKNYKRFPDAVIVEGPKAGGHLGFKYEQIENPTFQLENLIPEVVKIVNHYDENIPVIAAGGVYDGEDIKRMMELGAKGVQMGSRFVATHECDASDEFKQAFINSKKDQINIIKSPVGLPGRAITNPFIDEINAGIRKPVKCPWKCLKTCDYRTTPYCIADALASAQKGDMANGYAFAGAEAHRIHKIISVKELMSELEKGYINSQKEKQAAA
jgi:nitronate monooxygenase